MREPGPKRSRGPPESPCGLGTEPGLKSMAFTPGSHLILSLDETLPSRENGDENNRRHYWSLLGARLLVPSGPLSY